VVVILGVNLRRLWNDATKKPDWLRSQSGVDFEAVAPGGGGLYLTKSVRTSTAMAATAEKVIKTAGPMGVKSVGMK